MKITANCILTQKKNFKIKQSFAEVSVCVFSTIIILYLKH